MPSDVAQELALLSEALDRAVPSKQLDRNVLVASWNIRVLGRSNGKWSTEAGDTPKRNFADVHYIAKILSRFDVVAVQEVQDNLQALRQVMLLPRAGLGLPGHGMSTPGPPAMTSASCFCTTCAESGPPG
jgi:hypothetical protein